MANLNGNCTVIPITHEIRAVGKLKLNLPFASNLLPIVEIKMHKFLHTVLYTIGKNQISGRLRET